MVRHVLLMRSVTLLAMLCLPAVSYSAEPKKKLAIPDEVDQKDAAKRIEKVVDFKAAKSPAQKAELAKKLLQHGIESDDESTIQFVLFRSAVRLATEAGDKATFQKAVEETAKRFEVDSLKMKVSALEQIAKRIRRPKEREALISDILDLSDEAVAVDRYDHATKLGRMATSFARKIRNADLRKKVAVHVKEIVQIREAYTAAVDALVALKKTPTDPDANLIVGKFRCFYKGDWDTGVPMLALGSDKPLKEVAARDVRQPAVAKEQKKLADDWWDLAEKQKGVSKTNFLIRAGYWYEKAFPTLSGLDKRRVKQRLMELESPVVQAFTLPEGIVLSMSFDETSIAKKGGKTIVRDFSGKGNHGVIYGARTATGVRGSCLQFDGKTTYVDLDNSPSLQLTGDITIAFWIYADRFGGRTNPFAKAYGGEYAVSLEKSGGLNLVWGVTGGNRGTYKKNQYQTIRLVPPIQAKEWVYIQLVRDMRARKLIGYKNGVKMQEGETAYTSVRPSSDHVFIGKGYAGYFAGKIDELTVWNKALTPEEIRSIAEAYRMGRTILRP